METRRVLAHPTPGFSTERYLKPMPIKTSSTDNCIANNYSARITGPHMEPPEISNATTYWRCEGCGYESIREKDLYREAFHADGCANAGGI